MNPSGIITLTTDFGITDPYVATMKGVILSINAGAKVIDANHQVRAGSIWQAAALILEIFPYFPPGTVHVAVVDPGVGSERRLIALQARSHWFVGPDNGIFWPVLKEDNGALLVQLTETQYFLPRVTRTFHGREIFAPVAAHLSLGVNLEKMGRIIKNPVKLDLPIPHEDEDALYGQVIRIDNFGNMITNIPSVVFGRFLGTAMPRIQVGNLVIEKLRSIYGEAEEGEPLALINSSDLLEVAVNMGRACEYLGADTDEIIGTQVKVTRT
jgi:S-adenosylmethionine hydrolase